MKIETIVKELDNASSAFDSVVDSAQKKMLKDVLALSKDLETKNGQIVSSVKNLKLINDIKIKLNKAVLGKEYLSGVKDLLKSFDTIQQAQFGYFEQVSKGFTSNQKYDLVRQMAVENTAMQLTESGLDANVTSKLKDMLLRSVTSGGQYADLVGEVSEFLTDTEKSQGALSRYAKTYATTALSQFAGETNKLMIDDSGIEWYQYVGSNKETSREFCIHLTKKEWVHKSEFAELLKGYIDGFKCEIYDKTGLPKGMIDGTTESNLIINRGGWNCDHHFYAVDSRIVPQSAKNKVL